MQNPVSSFYQIPVLGLTYLSTYSFRVSWLLPLTPTSRALVWKRG